jgi:hypothetical protein
VILISACKQLQENQAIAWFLKSNGKNPPKQETLDFLERTVHRVGETAENQRKTREKTKVAENQVFWLDFCTKKNNCAYPLWFFVGFLLSLPPDAHIAQSFLRKPCFLVLEDFFPWFFKSKKLLGFLGVVYMLKQ